MITLTHTPQSHCQNHYKIEGDNIDELVLYCLQRIRAISQPFYKRELQEDLEKKGVSIIDIHAGMGAFYNVELIRENK